MVMICIANSKPDLVLFSPSKISLESPQFEPERLNCPFSLLPCTMQLEGGRTVMARMAKGGQIAVSVCRMKMATKLEKQQETFANS